MKVSLNLISWIMLKFKIDEILVWKINEGFYVICVSLCDGVDYLKLLEVWSEFIVYLF